MAECDPNDVGELRNKVLNRIKELPSDNVDKIDVEKWKKDDNWVKRFLVHNMGDVEQASTMALECLQWRKKLDVNSVNEKTLPKELMKIGGIYVGTEDKMGNKLLMFHGKLHHKDASLLPEKKRCIIYWMEKLEKEHVGKKVTVVFDMMDTGLGNMDMEIIKFIINLFKYYYPNCLAYILVFELPWILTAGWKIVKTWLSARAVDKIKFVTKSTIHDYIASEELPIVMGGSSQFKYTFDDSTGSDSAASSDTEPAESSTKKKVHFANDTENSQEIEEEEVKNHVLVDGHVKTQADVGLCFNGCLLRISPSEELIFSSEGNGDSSGTLYLMNNTENSVAFKVKTTSPEKFRVRPSSGTIKPMCRADVVVHLQFAYQNSNLARDKFLIMAMEVEKDDVGNQELFEMWKKCSKENIMEHKLRCSLLLPSPSIIRNDIVDSPVQKTTNNHPVSLNVTQELEKLHKKIQKLHRLLSLLVLMVFVMMVLSLLTLSTLWQRSQTAVYKPTSNLEFCNAIDPDQLNNVK